MHAEDDVMQKVEPKSFFDPLNWNRVTARARYAEYSDWKCIECQQTKYNLMLRRHVRRTTADQSSTFTAATFLRKTATHFWNERETSTLPPVKTSWNVRTSKCNNFFVAGVKAWDLKSLGNLPSDFFLAKKTMTRPISVFLVERGGGSYGRGLAVTKTNDTLLQPKPFYQSWTTIEVEQRRAVKTLFNTDVFVRFVISWVDLMGQF